MSTEKELSPLASAPSPPWDILDYIPYNKLIALSVCVVIICAIALVLFTKKYIDSHGLTLAFWAMMLFGSDVLDAWDVVSITAYIIFIHIVVNLLGLVYWISLGVGHYKKKSTWPSIDVLFEIGVWFFMFSLSWLEFSIRATLRNNKYFRVYRWYPIAIAFVSMVENYWMRNREMRVDQLKSQFIQTLEDAFNDFIDACMEEAQIGNIPFDQKVNDFTVSVAQHREALIVAQQQMVCLDF
ncbi:unnamed protein product [Cuscuta europaea]|uniref:Uncharacterized protein n=1 Tax=Cuscuta europaea TaxID=41803 RepID=A0A9P0YRE4_CUSEU|nr:unnamed protein product [Cuscuta europaea]